MERRGSVGVRGSSERCRASACGGICDVSTSTSKSATPDNSPTVPTSSSDAATRCATRKVASQCEDPGATEASETGKKCDLDVRFIFIIFLAQCRKLASVLSSSIRSSKLHRNFGICNPSIPLARVRAGARVCTLLLDHTIAAQLLLPAARVPWALSIVGMRHYT